LKGEQDRIDKDYSLLEETKGKSFSTISTQQSEQELHQSALASDAAVYYWNLPHCVYPVTVGLLAFPEYSYHILKGFAISVGGITESIVKFSYNSLKGYLNELNVKPNKELLVIDLMNKSTAILLDHANDERVLVPLFKTLEYILEADAIKSSKDMISKQIDAQVEIFFKETKGSKSILKIAAAVGVFVKLLGFNKPEISGKIVDYLLVLLFHKFPKIRKEVADKFYLYLMSHGDDLLGVELNEKISSILTDNDWLEISDAELHPLKPSAQEAFDDCKKALCKTG